MTNHGFIIKWPLWDVVVFRKNLKNTVFIIVDAENIKAWLKSVKGASSNNV